MEQQFSPLKAEKEVNNVSVTSKVILTKMTSNLSLILEYNNEYAEALFPNTVISFIFLSVGLIGNACVLVIYTFMLKDKLEARFFIPFLAFFDILTSVFSCTYFAFDNMHIVYFPWDRLCTALLFLSGMPLLTSVFLLLAIAVQRYTKICRPFGKQFTLFWRRISVVIIICVATVYCFPLFFVTGIGEVTGVYNGVNLTGTTCYTGNRRYPLFEKFYYGFIALIFVLNIIVTSVLYIPISIEIYKRQRRKKNTMKETDKRKGYTFENMSSSDTHSKETEIDSSEKKKTNMTENIESNSKEKRNKNGEKSVKEKKNNQPSTNFNAMFIAIVILYVISYVPTCTMLLTTKISYTVWDNISVGQLRFYNGMIRAYIVNHILNPFIYGYFDLQFRKKVTGIFHTIFDKCR